MVRALESFARLSSQGRHRAVDNPWELFPDELVVANLWADASAPGRGTPR